jgi:G1/S-specific cyclin-E1
MITDLLPAMRTILLDWLIDVSEVYKLHRETFYLAVDFFDRYLGTTTQVPKSKVQLVGE